VSTIVAPRPLLTRKEVAELLRVSVRTVDRLTADGVLRPVRLRARGRVTFRSADVQALIGRVDP
jgi:excisionase family DNA binding protein